MCLSHVWFLSVFALLHDGECVQQAVLVSLKSLSVR